MKKVHLTLLIVTAVLALSSAYSLAAMNQIYKVDMEWFSQLGGRYVAEPRDTSADRCSLAPDRMKLRFFLTDSRDSMTTGENYGNFDKKALPTEGRYDSFYIFCTLGEVDSPEYRIKIVDIAQRGNNVEVKVSINTPAGVETSKTWKNGDSDPAEKLFFPTDAVRIQKRAFPSAGRLYFSFKTQDGQLLYEQYYDI